MVFQLQPTTKRRVPDTTLLNPEVAGGAARGGIKSPGYTRTLRCVLAPFRLPRAATRNRFDPSGCLAVNPVDKATSLFGKRELAAEHRYYAARIGMVVALLRTNCRINGSEGVK